MVALILALALHADAPRVVEPSAPEAKEILAVVTEFFTLLDKGDDGVIKKLFNGNAEQAQLLDLQVRFAAESKSTRKAMVKAYGNVYDVRESGLDEDIHLQRIKAISALPIIIAGDRACVTASSAFVNPGLILERAEGRWRITDVAIPQVIGGIELHRELIEIIRSACVAFRPKVEAGEFRTVYLAQADLNGRLTALTPLLQKATEIAAQRGQFAIVKPAIEPVPPMFSLDDLRKLIGKESSSEDVKQAIARWPGLPRLSEAHGALRIESMELGIAFYFRRAHQLPDRLEGIDLLAPGINGGSGYRGELPKGLAFTDTRSQAGSRLGVPARSGDPSDTRGALGYYCDHVETRLRLTFARPDAKDADNPLLFLTLLPEQQPTKSANADVPRFCFREMNAGAEDDPDTLAVKDSQGKMLRVSRQVLLDEKDIRAARAIPQLPGRPKDQPAGLIFTLTADGAKRIDGKRLAIMLDGIVIAVLTARNNEERIIIESMTAQNSDDLRGHIHATINSLTTRPAAP